MHYEIKLSEDYQKSYKGSELESGFLGRETFFISEFIDSYLKKNKIKKLEIDGTVVKRIIVELSSSYNEALILEDCILCKLSFNYSEIFLLRGKKRIEKLLAGIAGCIDPINTLSTELGFAVQNALNAFSEVAYKNTWVHKKKKISGVGSARLECELCALYFQLFLVVDNKDNILLKKRILKTRADVFMYKHLFNNLVIENEEIKILDRISESPIFIISLDDIVKNKSGSFPENEMIKDTTKLDSEKHELVLDLKLDPRKTKWWDDFVLCYEETKSIVPCPNLDAD